MSKKFAKIPNPDRSDAYSQGRTVSFPAYSPPMDDGEPVSLDDFEAFPEPRIIPLKKPKQKKDEEDSDLKKLSKEELENTIKILKAIQKEKEDKKKKKEEEEPVEELGEVNLAQLSSFIVLPQLGSVAHPFYKGRSGFQGVGVGSKAWLHCLDELRAARWPKEYIDQFLMESAEVVKRDALYDVVDKDGVNHVEEFCIWYPDLSKQKERLDLGYAKLVADIRKSSGKPNPFIPEVIEEEKGKRSRCPPKPLDFKIGEKKFSNFLRNWTAKTENQVYDLLSGKSTFECKPPDNMKRSWIPVEWRKDIEQHYNIEQFVYIDTLAYQKYLVTLLNASGLPAAYKERDAHGVANIVVASQGGAYKLSVGQIVIQTPDCNLNETPKNEGDIPLRNWCLSKDLLEKYPEIYCVMLNVRAADNLSSEQQAAYVYEHLPKNSPTPKMYADAPLKLFQKQMLIKYANNHVPGETEQQCADKFVKNVYADVVRTGLNKSLRADYIPGDYKDLILRIFSVNGNKTCHAAKAAAANVLSPSLIPERPISRKAARDMSYEQKKQNVEKMIQWYTELKM